MLASEQFSRVGFAVMHATVEMSRPDSFSDPVSLYPPPRPSRVGTQRDRWTLPYCGDAFSTARSYLMPHRLTPAYGCAGAH